MKKRQFFTLALMGAALIFTTSCADDEGDSEPLGPALAVSELTSASVGGDIEATPSTALIFAIEARKGENDLDKFTLSQSGVNVVNPLPETYNGRNFPYEFPNANDNIYQDTIAFDAGLNFGITSYTFTVTDNAGQTSSVIFDVDVESATTDLSSPNPFTWTRVGGAAATGLAQFGLKWELNTGGFAIVAINSGTTMVQLPGSAWTSITTQEGLQAAIDNGNPVTTYDDVSTTQDANYDDVLAVATGGTNYLLHITSSTVTTSNAGTTITISGDSKN